MKLINRLLDEAIYAKLNGNLASSASVYNGNAPQNATYPYVVIGDDNSLRFGDKVDTNGQDIDHTIHVWAQYGSGFKSVKDIKDDALQLLTGVTYTISGFTVLEGWPRLAFEGVIPGRLGDNNVQHGILRLRFVTIEN